MLIICDVFLIIVDLVCAYYSKKPRLVIVLNFVFMFVILSGYFEGVDIFNYKYNYAQVAYGSSGIFQSDVGYALLERFCATRGFTFYTFKKICTLLSLIFLFKGIDFLTENPCFVYAGYLLYQIALDTIQFRNFMGCCFFVYALHFLFEDKMKSKIMYIIFILIAASFHTVMILYLLFLIKDAKYILRIGAGVCVFVGALTILNNMRIPFMRQIVFVAKYFLKTGDFSAYYSLTGPWDGSSYAFVLPIATLVAYIFIYRYFYKKTTDIEYYKIILNIDLVSLFSVPLCLIGFQWYRIVRNLGILNYCGVAEAKNRINSTSRATNNNRRVMVFFLLVIVFVWMYMDWFRFIGWDNLKTVFENNIYINSNY